MGLMEKIKEIEAEMAKTQKNKASHAFIVPPPWCLPSILTRRGSGSFW
jgi:hypothetical protein